MARKQPQESIIDGEEGLRAAARKLDLGYGIEVTMGLRREDGTIEVKYHFSNKLEGLKKTTRDTLGDLEVEVSSSLGDDQELLHYLALRTR